MFRLFLYSLRHMSGSRESNRDGATKCGEAEDAIKQFSDRSIKSEDSQHRVLCLPEVLEEIFKHSDFERRKKYRLVSRVWGVEAGRSIKKTAHLCFYGNRLISRFRTMISEGGKLSLPCVAAQEIILSVHLHNLKKSNFLWLSTEFRITKLALTASRTIKPELGKYAMLVIKKCSPTLTQLHTPFWDSPDDSSVLHFPKLELLYIESAAASNASAELAFFLRIIAMSPLLKQLTIYELSSVTRLLRQANLKKIKRLGIMSDDINVWWALERLQIDDLTHLKLHVPIGFRGYALCFRVLTRFSASLTYLDIGLNVIIEDTGALRSVGEHPRSFPLLPKLSELSLFTLGPNSLDLTNLPQLKSLEFYKLESYFLIMEKFISMTDYNPCVTVENISIWGSVLYMHSVFPYDDPLFISYGEKFFAGLFYRFPNARNWQVNYVDAQCFGAAVMSSKFIVHKLKIFLSDFILYPRTKDQAQALLNDQRVFSYFKYMPELEELTLCSGSTSLEFDMCLDEIDFGYLPKLKILRIYSNWVHCFQGWARLLQKLRGVKVEILGPRKLSGVGDISSIPNVDFLPYSGSVICPYRTNLTFKNRI